MPMKLSDRDLMIAEEYLRCSQNRSMTNPHDAPRARDVLALALDMLKKTEQVLRAGRHWSKPLKETAA